MQGGKPLLSLFMVGFVAVAVALHAQQAGKLDGEALMTTVRTLASPDFEGRRTGSPGARRAREWIQQRLSAIGLTPEPTNDGNVVAVCTPRAAAREMLVVSAHYDHLGSRNGVLYPGADDNASGVAVLLAIAAYCARTPFTHAAMFVAFDAEEDGLRGSKTFVAHPPVPLDRIALNVNLDMVSRSDRHELYAAGTFRWPRTRSVLEMVGKRAPVTLLFGHDKPKALAADQDDWTKQSDHAAFHDAGIPFVYFGVEDHADYHQPSDTADKIDVAFFRDAADTILDAVIALDAAIPFQ